VFIHNLDPFALESLRRAFAQGLTPSDLDFTEDGNDSGVILRFTRPRAAEVRLMSASNSILRTTKLSARSTTPNHNSNTLLNCAVPSSPENVRARVSRLLRELAARRVLVFDLDLRHGLASQDDNSGLRTDSIPAPSLPGRVENSQKRQDPAPP